MNQPIMGEPSLNLPKEEPTSEPSEKFPHDPVLGDLVLQNIFYYFEQRGYRMAVVSPIEDYEHPRIVNITGEDQYDGDLNVVRYLQTLESIRKAGPKYLRDMVNFVADMLCEY